MEETLTLQLTMIEANIILQMIDKSPVTGIQSMHVMLGLDSKIRQAVAELSTKPKIDV